MMTELPKEGQWARSRPGFYGLPLVSLVGSISDTRGFDLEDLGFVKFSSIKPDVPIPTPNKVALDLSSRFDADVVFNIEPVGERLFGAAFQDPHPGSWWDAIHERRNLLVVIGPMEEMLKDIPPTFDALMDRLSRMYIADLGLMLRAWPTGIGTHNETP